jgi:tetratricopeptide (TPR) repeat protein
MVKRYADAARSLRRALELRADYAEAWFALATVLERLFEPEAALSAYQRCVELDPSNMLARFLSGTILAELSRFVEAMAAHRRTLELYPDCVGARYLAETAALIENLDLVISVDTSVAHLAGALGKPVWLLLPFVPDWRWLLDRSDSPWYPTMRLFRQSCERDWINVIQSVQTELVSLVAS